MKPFAALVALAALAFATTAHASPNPFHEAYNGDVAVTDISVTYTDGILQSHSDRAAESFVADRFPAELRAEFEAFAAQRGGVARESYAERLSEFLVARSVRAQTAERAGARRVRLEVNVTDARVSGMISGAFFGGATFPRLGGDMRILDADTGALLATVTIANSQTWNAHNQAAERRHGFAYNFSGTDTNFRLLAGSTEGFAEQVQTVLFTPNFRDNGIVVVEMPRVEIHPPRFSVTLARPQE